MAPGLNPHKFFGAGKAISFPVRGVCLSSLFVSRLSVCLSVRFREAQGLLSITQQISSQGKFFSPSPMKGGDFPGMVVTDLSPRCVG